MENENTYLRLLDKDGNEMGVVAAKGGNLESMTEEEIREKLLSEVAGGRFNAEGVTWEFVNAEEARASLNAAKDKHEVEESHVCPICFANNGGKDGGVHLKSVMDELGMNTGDDIVYELCDEHHKEHNADRNTVIMVDRQNNTSSIIDPVGMIVMPREFIHLITLNTDIGTIYIADEHEAGFIHMSSQAFKDFFRNMKEKRAMRFFEIFSASMKIRRHTKGLSDKMVEAFEVMRRAAKEEAEAGDDIDSFVDGQPDPNADNTDSDTIH